MNARNAISPLGHYAEGDLLLTIPSNSFLYEMGQFDLVLLLDSTQPFSMLLTSGVSDAITFPPTSIERVFWRVNGVDVDSAARAVTADNKINWETNAAPPAGVQYSVTGRWMPDYFVYQDIPIERAHHFGERLPRKVVVRRFDLYGR